MNSPLNTENIYVPSDDIVAREIEGELIIVPISGGIGDFEDELFTLNHTGRAIWSQLDGKNSVSDIIRKILFAFDGPEKEIEDNVKGFMAELLKRKMIVEV